MRRIRQSDHEPYSVAAVAPEDSGLLTRAVEIFGDELTAVILTGRTWHAHGKKRELAIRNHSSQSALADAVDIAETLLDLEARTTVQAWFVGKKQLLDDRAPAVVIRTNPDAVRAAAKHFAAYG